MSVRRRNAIWLVVVASVAVPGALYMLLGESGYTETTVWQRGSDRIVALTRDQETLTDTWTHYRVIHRHGDRVATLFEGGMENYAPPQVASLSGGVIGIQFREFVCASTAGAKFRCDDEAPLEIWQLWQQVPTCCRSIGAAVTACGCSIDEPDPTLRAAYRWAAAGNDWRRARRAAISLTKLGDDSAAAAVKRLRRLWPDDPWLEKMSPAEP